MGGIVLDCSVAVSWLLHDESSGKSRGLLSDVCEHGAIVPVHWVLEVGNALLVAERRKRLTAEQRTKALHLIQNLPITHDTETLHAAWEETMELARNHQLTLYDAAYLELAQRMALPLASFDKALCQAAQAQKITLSIENG